MQTVAGCSVLFKDNATAREIHMFLFLLQRSVFQRTYPEIASRPRFLQKGDFNFTFSSGTGRRMARGCRGSGTPHFSGIVLWTLGGPSSPPAKGWRRLSSTQLATKPCPPGVCGRGDGGGDGDDVDVEGSGDDGDDAGNAAHGASAMPSATHLPSPPPIAVRSACGSRPESAFTLRAALPPLCQCRWFPRWCPRDP